MKVVKVKILLSCRRRPK